MTWHNFAGSLVNSEAALQGVERPAVLGRTSLKKTAGTPCVLSGVGVSHAQEKFNGTSGLHCRRDRRTKDQTLRVEKIYTILTSLCTFPLFLQPSVSQLIMEWTPKRSGSLYNGQWESRKAQETLSTSKENLRGRKSLAREEVDRQTESSLGHWGQRKGERKAQKQRGNKIIKSPPLNP